MNTDFRRSTELDSVSHGATEATEVLSQDLDDPVNSNVHPTLSPGIGRAVLAGP